MLSPAAGDNQTKPLVGEQELPPSQGRGHPSLPCLRGSAHRNVGPLAFHPLSKPRFDKLKLDPLYLLYILEGT